MKKYVALLRGINIGGKNKIKMSELKSAFEMAGLTEVRTVLNSGNIIFSSEADMNEEIIENIILEHFKMKIPVYLMKIEDLEDILAHSPKWWNTGKKDRYDNLIFIIPPAKSSDVYSEIGEPKKGLEKIEGYKEVIFWSFSRKDYQKTNWWSKTASANIGAKLTIRTANTVRKIVKM